MVNLEQGVIVESGVKRRQYLSEGDVSRIIDRHMREVIPFINNPNGLTVINLDGARWFAQQLLYRASRITGEDHSDQARYIKVKSATGQAQHGEVHIERWFSNPAEVRGKDIFVPEDINDLGHTLKKVVAELTKFSPKSITTAAQFEKDGVPKSFTPDIIFAHVPNKYWIGSGLDDGAGYGRELPGLWEVILQK